MGWQGYLAALALGMAIALVVAIVFFDLRVSVGSWDLDERAPDDESDDDLAGDGRGR